MEVFMRRRKNNAEKLKKYVYIFSITLFISFIIFISLFITYNKRLNESANKELQRLGKESKLLENEDLDNIKETLNRIISAENQDLILENTYKTILLLGQQSVYLHHKTENNPSPIQKHQSSSE